MNNSFHLSNKKGVSEVVGYVILIVIALTMSVFVYAYLKLYVPKEAPSCPSDISLSVQDYTCTSGPNGILNLTIKNKGLFKVYGAYVRFGPEDRQVRPQINNDTSFFLFQQGQDGLLPGNNIFRQYKLTTNAPTPGKYMIEVQPAVLSTKRNLIVACTDAVIVLPVTCT